MPQAITFSVSKLHVTWFCTTVYAFPVYTARTILWNHLSCLRSLILDPWILLGDLNEVFHHSEVSGGSFQMARAQLLAHMMTSCDFIDFQLVGGSFTWRKNTHLGHVREKLDRCMADVNWRLLFPHALAEILPQHMILITTPSC